MRRSNSNISNQIRKLGEVSGEGEGLKEDGQQSNFFQNYKIKVISEDSKSEAVSPKFSPVKEDESVKSMKSGHIGVTKIVE